MKTLKRMITMTMVSAMLLASCTKEESIETATSGNLTNEELMLEKATTVNGMTVYYPLDSLESTMLQFMREEEYLAFDVYSLFAQQYGNQIFINIKQSEYIHTTAIKNLLFKYGIEDPAANHQPGVFQNSELQELYNTLIASGSQSGQQAIEVGVAIETKDIEDLQNALLITNHNDVKRVLNNLKRASYNHLAAFNWWLN
jgi:hypothetical protein